MNKKMLKNKMFTVEVPICFMKQIVYLECIVQDHPKKMHFALKTLIIMNTSRV